MLKIIHPTADSFTSADGLLPHGAYEDIIKNTSTEHWDKQGGFVKRRRSQRKAWMFVGAYSEDLMVGLAIADAGYLANAFAYFYVPSEDLYKEQKVLVPYGFANNFDPTLRGDWLLRNFNASTIGDTMRVGCTGKFQLHMEIEHNSKGLSFMCPTVDRPFNFTYKNLCLKTSVKVFFQGKTFEMKGSMGGIDFSKGYPPRNTKWNWALISGTTTDGQTIGMNLFKGHNGKYENAAWIGEERILLPNTDFIYDKGQPLDQQNWQLSSENLEIDFIPSRARREKINAGVVSHDFTQPFGRFEGKLQHGARSIEFTGFGPVEEHESLW